MVHKNHFATIQFSRYIISGIAASLVHVLIFYSLAYFVFPSFKESDIFIKLFNLETKAITDFIRAVHSLFSNMVAYIASVSTAYVINRHWVFNPSKWRGVYEFGLFFIASGLADVLGILLMSLFIWHYQLDTTSAFILFIIITFVFNFIFRKYVIFKK